MFTQMESRINDKEAIALNYKIKNRTRTFDSNSGDSLWQYLCILTFQKIEVSKPNKILLPRTGRTKKIRTVEQRKKANINYCKKYRQKNEEAYRKADRERKKLARESLKYLEQKNTNFNWLKIELFLNVIEKGKETKQLT